MKTITKLGIPKIKALGLNNTGGLENSLEKSLNIRYLSFKEESGYINLEFEVQAKGLNSSNGFLSLFRESSLGFYSEGIAKLVNVSNGISRVKFTFNKYSNNIETAFTKEKNNYYALIAVNGISKKSDNFNINLNANSSASVDKKLTANDLSQMGVPTKTAQEYINDLNATFDEYKINTPLRKISFFGQVLSETEGFRIKSEQGVSDSDYGGFKGRGCMQLTGKSNYIGYEEYKKEKNPNIDFTSTTSNKDKINELPYYLDSGGWFWAMKTELNDDADRNDFIYVGYRVNGGFNHFDKRVDYYKKATKVLDKKYENTIFNLKDSYCYNIPKAAFGWGLWHDPYFPSTKFKGVTRDVNIAKQAYRRFLELHIKAGNPKLPENGWYGIKDIVSFVNQRLNSL
ncbi:glycoside hydrolase family 19 protein [Chryseobacterium schmidteae]|jgi:predicted chitinase|uniref:glycoside hydrolase family 19 protein n=1 Tax=Chryseobacterium schmidteae TaxID=2730404 RepID=UPI00158D2F58|nr:hypothetical protein [Chryseobacterium schmidteae]